MQQKRVNLIPYKTNSRRYGASSREIGDFYLRNNHFLHNNDIYFKSIVSCRLYKNNRFS